VAGKNGWKKVLAVPMHARGEDSETYHDECPSSVIHEDDRSNKQHDGAERLVRYTLDEPRTIRGIITYGSWTALP
jgi:hypothetical protein